ncbi:C3HC zinc finger-like-domain-containing protein [Sporodiniella umbellata]|nr:C3HC zinc finger-like-domain-containing protein [Sporodiniella umbellata]
MYTEISNELANSIDVEGDIETAILQDAQNSEIPKVESFKKPQEDVTEEILKDKVYTLQNLMKRVRKNFGILPASLKKRKSNECESNSEMFTKKLAVDIDEDLLLDQEREQLMSRLKSFSNIYYEKPRPLSALDCAQYGWSYLNTTFEQGSFIAVLECSYCSKNMFMADLDLQFCTKLQAEKIQTRYNEGLHAWHKNDCLWREKKFRIDDVYKLPVVSLTETANRIRREGKKISSQNIPPLQNELVSSK